MTKDPSLDPDENDPTKESPGGQDPEPKQGNTEMSLGDEPPPPPPPPSDPPTGGGGTS